MTDEKTEGTESETASKEAHAMQRASFKTLLLSNPNYFGNLVESQIASELVISGNTFYEELRCLGYQPQQKRLEAVIHIYQPSGYGSDVCGAGTPEYVRFYLSYDDGATWQDQGLTSFQSHNIPEGTDGRKRLEYAASLAVNPKRKPCFGDNIIRARAILSWNNAPPANQPNWLPVWGNRRDVNILVEPRRRWFAEELFEVADVKFPKLLEEVIDPASPIESKLKTFSASELAEQYKNMDVPVHRFAFKELSAFASGKSSLSAESFAALLPGITINPDIQDLLFPKTDGDTSFEELTCVGLDPNHPDTLVGVIHVKKDGGYSGGPCTNGSNEYVTFWGDFDGNGSFETCLGTAQVRVYDTAKDVFYAVRLPVDLSKYRQSCKKGPKVVRIRAILSWNVAVPCANPNKVPTWGNREETLINISPTIQSASGKILNMGGISVAYIDDFTGLTSPDAKFVINNLPPDNPDGDILTSDARPCPFGARVTVQGFPVPNHTYIVEVSEDALLWTPVLTDLLVENDLGILNPHKANPVTKRFDYLPFTQNAMLILAQWDTTGNAKWYVRLSVYDGGGFIVGTDTHRIQLDNTSPDASITITLGPGDCGKFISGTVLSGTFVATDDYLGSYSLGVEPAVNDPGEAIPSPSSGTINTAPAPGNAWTLDTTGMKACGYVIRVVASDRAILNSASVGHHFSDSSGFCLDIPVED
ncbi:MAG: hypothetical protein WBD22_08420 [Pyrinomonadaceae bacterium]